MAIEREVNVVVNLQPGDLSGLSKVKEQAKETAKAYADAMAAALSSSENTTKAADALSASLTGGSKAIRDLVGEVKTLSTSVSNFTDSVGNVGNALQSYEELKSQISDVSGVAQQQAQSRADAEIEATEKIISVKTREKDAFLSMAAIQEQAVQSLVEAEELVARGTVMTVEEFEKWKASMGELLGQAKTLDEVVAIMNEIATQGAATASVYENLDGLSLSGFTASVGQARAEVVAMFREGVESGQYLPAVLHQVSAALMEQSEASSVARQSMGAMKGRIDELAASGADLDALSGEIREIVLEIGKLQAAAGKPLNVKQLVAKYEEVEKAVADTRKANVEAARDASQAWSKVGQGISQAATSGAQFLTVIRLFAGENQGLQELAEKFVKIQAIVQALQSGQQALKGLSGALIAVGAAGGTAAAGTTAAGVASAGAATSMTGLAGAATAAGVALNTMIPILGIITIAIAAAYAAWKFFGDTAEQAGFDAEAAMDKLKTKTEAATTALEIQRQVLEQQSKLYEANISLRDTLRGDKPKSKEEIQQDQADRDKQIRAETGQKVQELAQKQVSANEEKKIELRKQVEDLQKQLEEQKSADKREGFKRRLGNVSGLIASPLGGFAVGAAAASASSDNTVTKEQRAIQTLINNLKKEQAQLSRANRALNEVATDAGDGEAGADTEQALQKVRDALGQGGEKLANALAATLADGSNSIQRSAQQAYKEIERQLKDAERKKERVDEQIQKGQEIGQQRIDAARQGARQFALAGQRAEGQRALLNLDRLDETSNIDIREAIGREVLQAFRSSLDFEQEDGTNLFTQLSQAVNNNNASEADFAAAFEDVETVDSGEEQRYFQEFQKLKAELAKVTAEIGTLTPLIQEAGANLLQTNENLESTMQQVRN